MRHLASLSACPCQLLSSSHGFDKLAQDLLTFSAKAYALINHSITELTPQLDKDLSGGLSMIVNLGFLT